MPLPDVVSDCVLKWQRIFLTFEIEIALYIISLLFPVFREILQKNGSDVDAMITMGLCNGLYNGGMMGLGGGHQMTIYIKYDDLKKTNLFKKHSQSFYIGF